MDKNVEDFLEHHGIKGQKWGVRNLDRLSRISRATGRGAKRTAKFVRKHPRGVATVAVGTAFAATLLAAKGSKSIAAFNDGSESFRSSADIGSSWVKRQREFQGVGWPVDSPVSEDTFAKTLSTIRKLK